MEKGPKFKFVRGLLEDYVPEGKHKDALYFTTNPGKSQIWMNGVCFANSVGLEGRVVSGVIINENNELIISYAPVAGEDPVPDFVYDLNVILKYASGVEDNMVVPVTLGNIKEGTMASELKEKSISQVLDDIIFPEIQPTVVAPVASLAFVGEFLNNGIYEVGSPAPKNPENFVTSFSRGSSKVVGENNLFRAGEIFDDETSFIYFGGKTSNKVLPEKITLGDMTYNYLAHYGQGDELVTSKGNLAEINPNPLPEGTVKSGEIKIYGTYPFFCNGDAAPKENLDPVALVNAIPGNKLPLQKWSNSVVGCKFAAESTTGERMVFEFPASRSVAKVEFMNTLSGKWTVLDPSEYTIVTLEEPKNINGIEVVYKQFTTSKDTPKKGALQVRFTFVTV